MSIYKQKLLLHTCCAPCAAGVFDQLLADFSVSAFFYNPNIYPAEEYRRRMLETQRFCQEYRIQFIIQKEKIKTTWQEKIQGLEQEPEGGKRCLICYTIRLEQTAQYASQHDFDIFATTLSISPHKKAEQINTIGKQLAEQYTLAFYAADFKKKDGFKKSLELSKHYHLYRQNYCGCQYSITNRKQ